MASNKKAKLTRGGDEFPKPSGSVKEYLITQIRASPALVTRQGNRVQRWLATETIIIGTIGVKLVDNSQWGIQPTFTYPRTQNESIQVVQAIQVMSRSWIKIAQRSPPHSSWVIMRRIRRMRIRRYSHLQQHLHRTTSLRKGPKISLMYQMRSSHQQYLSVMRIHKFRSSCKQYLNLRRVQKKLYTMSQLLIERHQLYRINPPILHIFERILLMR